MTWSTEGGNDEWKAGFIFLFELQDKSFEPNNLTAI